VLFGQVRLAVFEALSKYFSDKGGSPTHTKMARMPTIVMICQSC